jgi:hypothetical protein
LDDESKRSYLFGDGFWAHRNFAQIDFSCMSDLVLCDELAASVQPISIVVGPVLVPVSARCHHAVPTEWRDRVITDFALR